MSSVKKGFLLPEILLSVMILSLTVTVLAGTVKIHYTADSRIRQICKETEQQTAEKLKEAKCGGSCETPEEDS